MDILNDLITSTKKAIAVKSKENKQEKIGKQLVNGDIGGSIERSKRGFENDGLLEQYDKVKKVKKDVNVQHDDFLSRNLVTKLLRERKEPIRLFGETENDRLLRLRKLESLGLGSKDLQRDTGLKQHPLHRALEEEEEDYSNVNAELSVHDNKIKGSSTKNTDPQLDLNFSYNHDENHCSESARILSFIKRMLKEWDNYIAEFTDAQRFSQEGRKELKTYKQCKQSFATLLKLLKYNSVASAILQKVEKILIFCEQREYVKAAEAYLELAVGNEPWPIGVTSVGIHARKGRERINAENVAHVMNDEVQRRYITSIKRLLAFCQRKYPTDPSRMMQ